MFCSIALLAIISMATFTVAGDFIPKDVPQPYAGKSTLASPELLEGPENSTEKTIQDGELSATTEKLIKQGVIPAAVDKKTLNETTANPSDRSDNPTN